MKKEQTISAANPRQKPKSTKTTPVPLRHPPPQLIPSSSSLQQQQHQHQQQMEVDMEVEEQEQYRPSSRYSINSNAAPPPPPDDDNVSPVVRILVDIITRAPLDGLEAALSSTGVVPSPDCIEEVLKLVSASPSAAIKFFRWAGTATKLSVYSWNLMVELLGKNQLFEQVWAAIRSMKQEGLLSLATFVSVFGSYCGAGRIKEAFLTFDVMDRYGIEQDVVAVNSLLSAICEVGNQTAKAMEFFEMIKGKIAPDEDTFAILMEGWEKEGNVAKAKTTFGEMVIRVGWSPQNMSAYDAFLSTLVRGSQTDEALRFFKVMKGNNCFPGLKFFSTALDVLVKQNDSANAILLWDMMVDSGLVPNLIMYNAAIGLFCNNNEIDSAYRFLDEMVFNGTFPDSLTYNIIFQCLVKNKKLREASRFFYEMTKNEMPPTHFNCAKAIKMLFDGDDPETAIDIWTYMVENHIIPLEESGNELLLGLRRLGRLKEVRRFAEDMFDGKIAVYESTMDKLRSSFDKDGRHAQDKFHSLWKRWKAS